MRGYDVFGNIALAKFNRSESVLKKKKEALQLLKEHKNVTTVLEKTEKIKGRLRTLKTKWLAGIKIKEALYKENSCIFRFNIDKCYFSPRLATERKIIANFVKKNEEVLVLFGGVAPYAIVIAKLASPRRVLSLEISRMCNKYAIENVKRNKLFGKVEIIQGDVRKMLPKIREKFDRIIMSRPNLKDDFLDITFPRIKTRGIIHYYCFYNKSKIGEIKILLEKEAKKAKKKLKILRVAKAGDIGPYKYRYRADVRVLN